MRVLYVLDRGILGGIQRHTQCLADCLKDICDIAVCIVGELGPLGMQMRADRITVYALNCRNGHDPRLFWRFEQVVQEFRPDIIHGQVLPAFCRLWVRFRHSDCPVVMSLHTPAARRRTFLGRLVGIVFGCKVMYYLPVSQATWDGFRRLHPEAKGEVFYNPIRVDGEASCHDGAIGVLGRLAKQKDWGSFVETVKRVVSKVGRAADVKGGPSFKDVVLKVRQIEAWGVGVSEEEAVAMFGDDARHIKWQGTQNNGREWIRKMGLFVLTSLHEEMPTVVLECFAEKTPICGFIPKGGMREVLSYSTGALREVFIEERDCDKLAEIVLKVLNDDDLRQRIIEDGWHIVSNYFDAEKNCRDRLMEIYSRLVDNSL